MSAYTLQTGESNAQFCRRCVGRLFHIRSERSHLKVAFKSSISIQSRRPSLLRLRLSRKSTPHTKRPPHGRLCLNVHLGVLQWFSSVIQFLPRPSRLISSTCLGVHFPDMSPSSINICPLAYMSLVS